MILLCHGPENRHSQSETANEQSRFSWVLQTHVITNGNFSSIENLNLKIENYIAFFNKCLVKPTKWKFKGFIKSEKLLNLKLSNN